MAEILKMSAFLVLVCAVSAAALSVTNAKTRPLIEEQERLNREAARREVLPGAETFEPMMPKERGFLLGKDGSGNKVGYVGIAVSTQGYSGKVEVMAGVDLEGNVTGVKVMKHKETPGLGTTAIDPEEAVIQSILGKGAEVMALTKDDPTGKVDAITSVTKTSRAITDAVRMILEGLEVVREGKKAE
ncbi:MAG: FMN-binding protein [Planctomycetota bacterium]|jgi:electron transport complex protein RnfG